MMLFLGIIYIYNLNDYYDAIYKNIEGEKSIVCVVISDYSDKEYKYRYRVKIISINNDEEYSGIELYLDIKLEGAKYIPEFGDKILVKGEISIPNTSRNYKGFDYKEYLKTQKIFGTIDGSEILKISENATSIISKGINIIQNSMKKSFNRILDEEEASLCIGILIGDRSDISDEVETNFKNSNLTHMLAVSGSHITYIINGFALLLGNANKRAAKIATIIFLLFFMILTSFTSSVLRASFMGILILVSSLIHRKPDTINNLGISALILLLINPYTILDIGFILSFAGTLGIIMFSKKITKCFSKILPDKKNLNFLIDSFSITISANIMIIPIMAYSFSTVSFTFWISNILAGPIMEIVTILGFIVYFISLAFFPLAFFLGIVLNFLLSLLLKIAEISSLIPGSSVYIKTPYLISCVVVYVIIFLVYTKRFIKIPNLKFFNKVIVIVLIIIICSTKIINEYIPRSLYIYFIDVGQGDSTLIRTMYNKTILIDGGGFEFGTYDVGESTLLPYLLDRRITSIDYIIISHFDSDHVKGILTVMENLKVKNIIISKQGKYIQKISKLSKI